MLLHPQSSSAQCRQLHPRLNCTRRRASPSPDTIASITAFVPEYYATRSKSHSEITWNHVIFVFTLFATLMSVNSTDGTIPKVIYGNALPCYLRRMRVSNHRRMAALDLEKLECATCILKYGSLKALKDAYKENPKEALCGACKELEKKRHTLAMITNYDELPKTIKLGIDIENHPLNGIYIRTGTIIPKWLAEGEECVLNDYGQMIQLGGTTAFESTDQKYKLPPTNQPDFEQQWDTIYAGDQWYVKIEEEESPNAHVIYFNKVERKWHICDGENLYFRANNRPNKGYKSEKETAMMPLPNGTTAGENWYFEPIPYSLTGFVCNGPDCETNRSTVKKDGKNRDEPKLEHLTDIDERTDLKCLKNDTCVLNKPGGECKLKIMCRSKCVDKNRKCDLACLDIKHNKTNAPLGVGVDLKGDMLRPCGGQVTRRFKYEIAKGCPGSTAKPTITFFCDYCNGKGRMIHPTDPKGRVPCSKCGTDTDFGTDYWALNGYQ